MRNIKLTIEYDGKRYSGWQRLGNSEKTIQGKIESILTQMTGEPIEIIGSGRTDAGTHARGQVANFKTTSSLTTTEMLSFLNRYLPAILLLKKLQKCLNVFMHGITPQANNTATMFGIAQFLMPLNGIIVFTFPKRWIKKKWNKLAKN